MWYHPKHYISAVVVVWGWRIWERDPSTNHIQFLERHWKLNLLLSWNICNFISMVTSGALRFVCERLRFVTDDGHPAITQKMPNLCLLTDWKFQTFYILLILFWKCNISFPYAVNQENTKVSSLWLPSILWMSILCMFLYECSETFKWLTWLMFEPFALSISDHCFTVMCWEQGNTFFACFLP